jgi:transcription elongation factor Elf1
MGIFKSEFEIELDRKIEQAQKRMAQRNIKAEYHKNTNDIVCPYCGTDYCNSWEYENDMGEIVCESCNSRFTYEREVWVTYSTKKGDK